ncbi:MAG: hypothetical protein IJ555_07010 [Ruminococcus sp.]|nr:hypothetical protein [Ruminococcus sp.]MBR1751475.1 hypothetical protein [Ruminococcus sp.]
MRTNGDKKKALLIAIFKWLECELFCIVTFIFYMVVVSAMGKAAHVVFALVCLLLVICITADFGLKQGYSAHKGVKAGTLDECINFGAVLGLASALPTYICFVLLLLSSNGVIGNFYPAYKLINSMFAPAVNVFAVTADAAQLSAAQLVGIGILPLVFPLVAWVSFRLGYNDTDLAKKFLYKNTD